MKAFTALCLVIISYTVSVNSMIISRLSRSMRGTTSLVLHHHAAHHRLYTEAKGPKLRENIVKLDDPSQVLALSNASKSLSKSSRVYWFPFLVLLLVSSGFLIHQFELFPELTDPKSHVNLPAYSQDWEKIDALCSAFELEDFDEFDEEALASWKARFEAAVWSFDLSLITKYTPANHVSNSNVWSRRDVKSQFQSHVLSTYLAKTSEGRTAYLTGTTVEFKNHLFSLAQSKAQKDFRLRISSQYNRTQVNDFYQIFSAVLNSPEVKQAPNIQASKIEFIRSLDSRDGFTMPFSTQMTFSRLFDTYSKALEDTKELRSSLSRDLEIFSPDEVKH